MNSTLLIRADASSSIGLGHIMRCIALAQAWRRSGGNAVFLTTDADRTLHVAAEREGFSLCDVSRAADGLADLHDITQVAKDLYAEWIVFDGTAPSEQCVEALRGVATGTLIVDDGLTMTLMHADIVVNPNHRASIIQYQGLPTPTRILAGAEYILLRQDVIDARVSRESQGKGTIRILITMGGSDPEDITGKLLKYFREVSIANAEATVIVGALYNKSERDWGSGFKIPVRIQPAVNTLVPLMLHSDVAVICAGGTLWESLYLGVPVMSFSRNNVQHVILTALAEDGMAEYFGRAEDDVIALIGSRLAALCADSDRRRFMAKRGSALIDGRGADRIVCEMKEYVRVRS